MKGKSLLLSLVISSLLMSLMATSAHAEKHESSSLWWGATVEGSERYPGGTVCLESWFVDAGLNTTSYVLSIDTISWTTPWETYVETKTPVTLYPGDGFSSAFNVKIPDNQPTGNVSLILSVTWRYRATYERAWSAGNAILYKSYFELLPNPYILQAQINSLNSSYKALNSSFNSLQMGYNSLQKSYTSLKGDYDSLNASYASLIVSYGKLKDDYDKLKTQLESTTTQLKVKMDELTTNTNLLYVSIVTIIAFVASTVYFARRKSKTT